MILELEVRVEELGSEIGAHEDWSVLDLIDRVVYEKSGTSFPVDLVFHLLKNIKGRYERADFEDFVIEIARWADNNG